MHTIHRTPYFLAEYDALHDVVVLRRQPHKYSSFDDIANVFSTIFDALKPFLGKPLLSDLRLAPSNNDPVWESHLKVQLKRLTQLFPVRASLVQTAAGRLQIMRLSRERGEIATNVFTDEAEAIAYLIAHRR